MDVVAEKEVIAPSVRPRLLMLEGSRVRLAELDRQEWIANVEDHTTIEDILQPGFWSMVSAQMQPYDHIEVRVDDGSWVANFLVVECARNWAKTVLLAKYDLTQGAKSDHKSIVHEVKFKGPHYKWSVIRIQDGEKIKTGFASVQQANNWLREFESNVN